MKALLNYNLLNYKPTKYLKNKLNILDDKIIIRISNYKYDEEIRNIIKKEPYFIKIYETFNYPGKILPFTESNLFIEIVEQKKRPLSLLINKLSIELASDIQFHLYAIIIHMFNKYQFINPSLSLNNIYFKFHKRKKKYFIGDIYMEDNVSLYFDENNNSSLEIKYNLISEIINARKMCLSLLKDKEKAFENNIRNKEVFEDYEKNVEIKMDNPKLHHRIYPIALKLLTFIRFK